MGLGLLQIPKLHDHIEEQIIDLVVTGEFKPGDRLPAERELAQRYGVARGSVRQAVLALELDGVLDIRMSSGIYIAEQGVKQAYRRPAMRTGGMPPLDVLQARRAVEGETAALAAGHAGAEDIALVRAAFEELSEHESRYDLRHPADRKFHAAIAVASGNKALAMIVQDLWEMQRGKLYMRMEDHFASVGMRDNAVADHEKILNCIEAGDSYRARAAMHQHLDRLYMNLANAPYPRRDPLPDPSIEAAADG